VKILLIKCDFQIQEVNQISHHEGKKKKKKKSIKIKKYTTTKREREKEILVQPCVRFVCEIIFFCNSE